MKSIAIFPATGALGTSTHTHLVRLLAQHNISPSNLTLISRFPEKITHKGVPTRQASYDSSSDSLQAAFAGIDVLFLISYPSHVHAYRSEVQLPALDAAYKAGVRHVFYSSLAFGQPHAPETKAEVMRAHLDTEEHLRRLGQADAEFTWTSIREGLYHESFPIYTSFFDINDPVDEICIPHDGSGPGIPWVKRDELGEATASLLLQYASSPTTFPHLNHILSLTGPKELSLGETVQVLAKAIGHPTLRIREISVDEYVALPQVLKVFGSQELARSWATAWTAIKAGETAYVSPTLEEVLGRKPEDFAVTVKTLAHA